MKNYAIVGGGRLAHHFSHYFNLLEIPHTCWSRQHSLAINSFELHDAESRLRQTIKDADCVLLLVSDSAITPLLKQYSFLHDKPLVHCSGSLTFPGIAGFHPLMTFADQLYQLATYRSIPFVCETGHDFSELFPSLPNPHFTISIEDKARYHALCVMAGNFPQMLWGSVSDHFEKQIGVPADVLHPYLNQLAVNFVRAPGSALTGPLVREDKKTITRNIDSLDGDPLQDIYRTFVDFYHLKKDQISVSEQTKKELAQ